MENYVPLTINEFVKALNASIHDPREDLTGEEYILEAKVITEEGYSVPPNTIVLRIAEPLAGKKWDYSTLSIYPSKVRQVM